MDKFDAPMAVNRVLRGSNLGNQVLQALINAARDRGDTEVLLHAQRSAEGFYAKAGFAVRGEPFDAAGIAQVETVVGVRALRARRV